MNQENKTLYTDCLIVTARSLDVEPINHGALLVEGDRIVEVGKKKKLEEKVSLRKFSLQPARDKTDGGSQKSHLPHQAGGYNIFKQPRKKAELLSFFRTP